MSRMSQFYRNKESECLSESSLSSCMSWLPSISESDDEGITRMSINLLVRSETHPEPFTKQSARHRYPELGQASN